MSMNLITVLYLVASVCFIQALKGLSHPTTSRRGNVFGMVGMGIAVVTTVFLVFKLGAQLAVSLTGVVIGWRRLVRGKRRARRNPLPAEAEAEMR